MWLCVGFKLSCVVGSRCKEMILMWSERCNLLNCWPKMVALHLFPQGLVLVCRGLSNMLLLPWPSLPESEQQWPARSANLSSLLAALTRQYCLLRCPAGPQHGRLCLEEGECRLPPSTHTSELLKLKKKKSVKVWEYFQFDNDYNWISIQFNYICIALFRADCPKDALHGNRREDKIFGTLSLQIRQPFCVRMLTIHQLRWRGRDMF